MAVQKSMVWAGRVDRRRVKTPHYENVPPDALLPPRGEDVWVDHPIFKADEALSDLLACEGIEYVIQTHRSKDDSAGQERVKEMRDWMSGRIPIPDATLERMLLVREIEGMDNDEPLPPVRQGGVVMDEELEDALKYANELAFRGTPPGEKVDIDVERLKAAEAAVKRVLYGDEPGGDESAGDDIAN